MSRPTLLNRFALSVAALGLAVGMTGCCCHRGGGCGSSYSPSPCGPCGASYAPSYGAPATLGAPGGCPTGNCGAYQGAYNVGGMPATAFAPTVVTTAMLPMDVMPTY